MTEAALLAAILDAPEDDAPRLIYADWLDENTDDLGLRMQRAEFIRVQCRLAELKAGVKTYPPYMGQAVVTVPPAMPDLRRRERELLDSVVPTWHIWPAYMIEWQWRRGFVHSITLSAADWLKHGDAILVVQPVEEVTLTTWPVVVFDNGDDMHFTSERAFSGYAEAHWPRVKKWTLPATSYSNYEIVSLEERQETQRSRSHDIR